MMSEHSTRHTGRSATRWLRLLALVFALVLAATACASGNGGDSSDDGTDAADDAQTGDSADGGEGDDTADSGDPVHADSGYEDGDIITLVTGFSAGGGFDTNMRLVAPYFQDAMRELTGKDITVSPQNLPGAQARIAIEAVANAEPDGTFLGFLPFDVRIPHDTSVDAMEYTYLAHLTNEPKGILIRSDLELEERTWDGFVARAQEEPILFGFAGQTGFTLMHELITDAGIDFPVSEVPFGSASDMVAALLRGEIEAAWTTASTLNEAAEQNEEAEMLVQTGCERTPAVPDVPTLAESGVSTAERICLVADPIMRIFVAPGEVPQEKADVLVDAFEMAINDPDHLAEQEAAGFVIDYRGPEESRELVQQLISIYNEYADRL